MAEFQDPTSAPLKNSYQEAQAQANSGEPVKPIKQSKAALLNSMPNLSSSDYSSSNREFQFSQRPLQMEAYNEYDKGFIPDSGMSQEHNRANNQSSLDLIAKGVKRLAVSIPLKIGEGISDVAGLLISAPMTIADNALWAIGKVSQLSPWGMELSSGNTELMMPSENALSVGLRNAEDAWKEHNPVYRSQAYDEGTVWQKISSGSFLANDAVDGIAFMAGAMIGTKGIGAGINALTKAALPGLEIAGAAAEAGRDATAGSKFVQKLLDLGIDSNKIARGTTTAFNTVSESMAEGVDSYTQVKEELLRKKQLGLMGHSGYEKYAQIGDDVIEQASRSAYQETFASNLVALSVPNWIESGWWLGKAGKAGLKEAIEKAIISGKITSEFANSGFRQSALAFAEGFAAEGLWEENIQSAIQSYEKTYNDPTLSDNERKNLPYLASVLGNAATNLKGIGKFVTGQTVSANSEEGQGAISIILGGALGSPMSVYGHLQDINNEKLQTEEVTKEMARFKRMLDNNVSGLGKEMREPIDGLKRKRSVSADGKESSVLERDAKGNPILDFNVEKKTRDILSSYFKTMTANHAILADMTDNQIYGAVHSMHSLFNAAMEIEQTKWSRNIKDHMAKQLIENYSTVVAPSTEEQLDEKGSVTQEKTDSTKLGENIITLERLNAYRNMYNTEWTEAYNKVYKSFEGGDVEKKRFFLDTIRSKAIETFRLNVLETLRNGGGGINADGTLTELVASDKAKTDLDELIKEKKEHIDSFDLRKNRSGIEAMYQEYRKASSANDKLNEYVSMRDEKTKYETELDNQIEEEIDEKYTDDAGKETVRKVKRSIGVTPERKTELEAKVKELDAKLFLKQHEFYEHAGVTQSTRSKNFYHDETVWKDAKEGKDVSGLDRLANSQVSGHKRKVNGRFGNFDSGTLQEVQNVQMEQAIANIQFNRQKFAGDLTLIDMLNEQINKAKEVMLNHDLGKATEQDMFNAVHGLYNTINSIGNGLYKASLFSKSTVNNFVILVEQMKQYIESLSNKITEIKEKQEAGNQILAAIESVKSELTDFEEEDNYEEILAQELRNAGIGITQEQLNEVLAQLALDLIDTENTIKEYTSLLNGNGTNEIGLNKFLEEYQASLDNKKRLGLSDKNYGTDPNKRNDLEIESTWNINPTIQYFRDLMIRENTDELLDKMKVYYDEFDKLFVDTPEHPFEFNNPKTWELLPDAKFSMPLSQAKSSVLAVKAMIAAMNVPTESKEQKKIQLEYKNVQRLTNNYTKVMRLQNVLNMLEMIVLAEENRQGINIERMAKFEEKQKQENQSVLNLINGDSNTILDDSYGLFRELNHIKAKSDKDINNAKELLKSKKKAVLAEVMTALNEAFKGKQRLSKTPEEMGEAFDNMSALTRLNHVLLTADFLRLLLNRPWVQGDESTAFDILFRDAFAQFSFMRTLQSTGDLAQVLYEIEKDETLNKPEFKEKKKLIVDLFNKLSALVPLERAGKYMASTIGDNNEDGQTKYNSMVEIMTTIDMPSGKGGLGYAPNYLQLNAFIESVIGFDISEQREQERFKKQGTLTPEKAAEERGKDNQLQANLLLGVSGSGKTVGTQLLLKYFLNTRADGNKKVLLVGHVASSAKNLQSEAEKNLGIPKDSIRAVTNLELYNMSIEERNQYELIIADEQFTLSSNEFNGALKSSLRQFSVMGDNNLPNVKIPVVFLMGDSSQPRGEINAYMTSLETVAQSLGVDAINRLTPLSIGYRASVQAIEATAYRFKANLDKVKLDSTEANKTVEEFLKQDDTALLNASSTLGIIGMISESDASEATRIDKIVKLATKIKSIDATESVVIIVANEQKKATYLTSITSVKELEGKNVEVMTFLDVQGRTFDNVLIDFVDTDTFIQRRVEYNSATKQWEEVFDRVSLESIKLNNKINADYKKNANIYMSITRGKKFVYMNGVSDAETKVDNKLTTHVFKGSKEANALTDNYTEFKKNFGVESTKTASEPIVDTATPEDTTTEPTTSVSVSISVPTPTIAVTPDAAAEAITVTPKDDIETDEAFEDQETTLSNVDELMAQEEVIQSAKDEFDIAMKARNAEQGSDGVMTIQHPSTIEGITIDSGEQQMKVQQAFKYLLDREQTVDDVEYVYPSFTSTENIPQAILVPKFRTEGSVRVEPVVFIPLVRKTASGPVFTGHYVAAGQLRHIKQDVFESETEKLGVNGLYNKIAGLPATSTVRMKVQQATSSWNSNSISEAQLVAYQTLISEQSPETDLAQFFPVLDIQSQSDLMVRNFGSKDKEAWNENAENTIIKFLEALSGGDNVNDKTLRDFLTNGKTPFFIINPVTQEKTLNPEYLIDGMAKARKEEPALVWEIFSDALVNDKSYQNIDILSQSKVKGFAKVSGIKGHPVLLLKNIPIGKKANGEAITRDFFITLQQPRLSETSKTIEVFKDFNENLTLLKNNLMNLGFEVPETLLNTHLFNLLLYAGQDLFYRDTDGRLKPKTEQMLANGTIKQNLIDALNRSLTGAKDKILDEIYKNRSKALTVTGDRDANKTQRNNVYEKARREQQDKTQPEQSKTETGLLEAQAEKLIKLISETDEASQSVGGMSPLLLLIKTLQSITLGEKGSVFGVSQRTKAFTTKDLIGIGKDKTGIGTPEDILNQYIQKRIALSKKSEEVQKNPVSKKIEIEFRSTISENASRDGIVGEAVTYTLMSDYDKVVKFYMEELADAFLNGTTDMKEAFQLVNESRKTLGHTVLTYDELLKKLEELKFKEHSTESDSTSGTGVPVDTTTMEDSFNMRASLLNKAHEEFVLANNQFESDVVDANGIPTTQSKSLVMFKQSNRSSKGHRYPVMAQMMNVNFNHASIQKLVRVLFKQTIANQSAALFSPLLEDSQVEVEREGASFKKAVRVVNREKFIDLMTTLNQNPERWNKDNANPADKLSNEDAKVLYENIWRIYSDDVTGLNDFIRLMNFIGDERFNEIADNVTMPQPLTDADFNKITNTPENYKRGTSFGKKGGVEFMNKAEQELYNEDEPSLNTTVFNNSMIKANTAQARMALDKLNGAFKAIPVSVEGNNLSFKKGAQNQNKQASEASETTNSNSTEQTKTQPTTPVEFIQETVLPVSEQQEALAEIKSQTEEEELPLLSNKEIERKELFPEYEFIDVTFNGQDEFEHFQVTWKDIFVGYFEVIPLTNTIWQSEIEKEFRGMGFGSSAYLHLIEQYPNVKQNKNNASEKAQHLFKKAMDFYNKYNASEASSSLITSKDVEASEDKAQDANYDAQLVAFRDRFSKASITLKNAKIPQTVKELNTKKGFINAFKQVIAEAKKEGVAFTAESETQAEVFSELLYTLANKDNVKLSNIEFNDVKAFFNYLATNNKKFEGSGFEKGKAGTAVNVAFKEIDTVNEQVRALRQRVEGDVLTYAQSVLAGYGLDPSVVKLIDRMTDAHVNAADRKSGKTIYGYVERGAIALDKSASKKDFKHEFFHYTFRYLMTEQERKLMIINAEQSFGNDFKKLSYLAKEEFLAEEFEDYMRFRKFAPNQEKQASRSFLVKVFDWLLDLFNLFVDKQNKRKFKSDFEAIRTGKYKIYNNEWDKIYLNAGYNVAFNTGEQVDSDIALGESEQTVEATTIHGLIRQTFNELPDASETDYLEYTSFIELTINQLYKNGKDGFVYTYHQAIGESFNIIERMVSDNDSSVKDVFKKLNNYVPDRKKRHAIFKNVINSIIENADNYTTLSDDKGVIDDQLEMAENIINKDNEKKKIEDNPTTHLRHVLRTFFREVGSNNNKQILGISKNEILEELKNTPLSNWSRSIDAAIDWVSEDVTVFGSLKYNKGAGNDAEFNSGLRPSFINNETNRIAIRRRIIQMLLDASIESSDNTDSNKSITDSKNPTFETRKVSPFAGDMTYVYDKKVGGYGFRYMNNNHNEKETEEYVEKSIYKTIYIDGRTEKNLSNSPSMVYELIKKEIEDVFGKDSMQYLMFDKKAFNLLIRRAEALENLKSVSQTLGSMIKIEMYSDSEGYVKGKLEMKRRSNSSNASYKEVKDTLSKEILSEIEKQFSDEKQKQSPKSNSEAVNSIIRSVLKAKGLTQMEIDNERRSDKPTFTKAQEDQLVFFYGALKDWLEYASEVKVLFNNRNEQTEEESTDFYSMLEEHSFSPTMGGNQFLSYDKAMSDIADEINAFDTAKVKLTMKSANGDILYLFQNSTFMLDVWRELHLNKSNSKKLKAILPFLNSKNFEHNAFANGAQVMNGFKTFDAYKNEFTQSVKQHISENEQEYLRRIINYSFLGTLSKQGETNTITYDQETFPLEGRARLQTATIKFLDPIELKNNLDLILKQLRSRENKLIQDTMKGQVVVNKDGSLTNHILNYLSMSTSMLLNEGVSQDMIDAFNKVLNAELITNSETDSKELTDKIYSALMPIMNQLGKSVWQNMVKYEKSIQPEFLFAASNLVKQGWLTQAELDFLINAFLPSEEAAKIGNVEKKVRENGAKEGPKDYFYGKFEKKGQEAIREKIDTIMGKVIGSYQANKYINSYHLNQVFAGDLLAYGKDLDLIKRLLGPSTPSQNFHIDNRVLQGKDEDFEPYRARLRGTSPTTRAIIINDNVIPTAKNYEAEVDKLDENNNKILDADGNPVKEKVIRQRRSLESTLDRILNPKDEKLRRLIQTEESQLSNTGKEEDVNDVNSVIKSIMAAHGNGGFEMTDGYCIMLPSGYENLKKGLSAAYELGDAQKLIYFGIDKHLESLSEKDIATPYYVKSSYLVLTKELTDQYPALAKLAKFLLAAKVEEAHFTSAIKVGATKERIDYSDIMGTPEQSAAALAKIESSKLVVTMNNKYRGTVYNPISKLDSKISLFTQMFYMQMINTPQAEKGSTITSALGFLFEKGIAKEIENMEGNFGKFIQDTIAKSPVLAANYNQYLDNKTLSNEDIERLMTDANIKKTVMTAIVSTITKNAINVNFKGAKLISAPSEILTSASGEPLTLRQEYVTYKTLELDENGSYQNVEKEMVQYTSDAIVPEAMLTKEQKEWFDALEKNKDSLDRTGIDVHSHYVSFEKGDMLSMRLPTTGKHSGCVLRIVGYHKSPANVVFVSPEASKIMGEDYDVDSRFTVFREMWKEKSDLNITVSEIVGNDSGVPIETKYSISQLIGNPVGYYKKKINYSKQVQVVDPETKQYSETEYELSKEKEYIVWATDKEFIIKQTQTIAKIKEILNKKLAKARATISTNPEADKQRNADIAGFNRDLKALDKYEDILLKNLIVETIMDNLSSPNHIKEMMLPITTEQFNPLIETLRANGWHNEMSEKYNPSIIPDAINLHGNIHGGDIITGAGANGFKELAYLFNTALDETGRIELDAWKKKQESKKRARKLVLQRLEKEGFDPTPNGIAEAKRKAAIMIAGLSASIDALKEASKQNMNDYSKREDLKEQKRYWQKLNFNKNQVTKFEDFTNDEFREIEKWEDTKELNAIYANSSKRSLIVGNKKTTNRNNGLTLKTVPIKIGNTEYAHFTENGYWYDENGEPTFGMSVWEQLDAIINLALDNLKENKLGKLNISNDTFQAILGGLALGIPFEPSNNILGNLVYQPAVKILVQSQYVGISNIHDRIGLEMVAKGNASTETIGDSTRKVSKARPVARAKAFREGSLNSVGDTLVKLLTIIDKTNIEANGIRDEEADTVTFFDLDTYLSSTSVDVKSLGKFAHKGYFKAITALLDKYAKATEFDLNGVLGSDEKDLFFIVREANAILSKIKDAEEKEFVFTENGNNKLFTNDTFVDFLKVQLKALATFKQLELIGAELNVVNKRINALRINPTDAVEIAESLNDKKIYRGSLSNMETRYTKGMSFVSYEEAAKDGSIQTDHTNFSFDFSNFMNQHPHIFGANLALEKQKALTQKFMPSEDPVFEEIVEEMIEFMSEEKFDSMFTVRVNNRPSDVAKRILVKEELMRFAIVNGYSSYKEENYEEEGSLIDFTKLSDSMKSILEKVQLNKDERGSRNNRANANSYANNLILSSLVLDGKNKLRFRGDDVLDVKNTQAYLMAAQELKNFYYSDETGEILNEAKYNEVSTTEEDKMHMLPLDIYLGLYLKLEQQGYSGEHKVFQLLSSQTQTTIADISLFGMQKLKETIENGRTITSETRLESGQERTFTSIKYSNDLIETQKAFTESLLRRNVDLMPNLYHSPEKGMEFENHTGGDFYMTRNEKSKPDYSGLETKHKLPYNDDVFYYDLKIVSEKSLPPYIRKDSFVFVRLESYYDREVAKKIFESKPENKGIAFPMNDGAEGPEGKHNVSFYIKLPLSRAFTTTSFLSNRLSPDYLSIVPYKADENTFTVKENLKKRLDERFKNSPAHVILYDKNDVSLSNPQYVKILSEDNKGASTVIGSKNTGFIYNTYNYEVMNVGKEELETISGIISKPIFSYFDMFKEAKEILEKESNKACER